MFASLLAFLSALLKLFNIGAEAAKESKDQTTGAELQKGADAEKAYDDLTHAMAARDAVVPLDASGRLPDGSRDPNDRG